MAVAVCPGRRPPDNSDGRTIHSGTTPRGHRAHCGWAGGRWGRPARGVLLLLL